MSNKDKNFILAHLLASMFDAIGGFRTTTYNEAAIAFIRKGAKLGIKVADKLPMALRAHEAQSADLLNTRGDDSGYQTILRVSELLVQTATKRLYYAQREEDAKVALRTRVTGYSLSPALESAKPITPDAWAEETTIDEGEDVNTIDMNPEARGMEEADAVVRLSAEDIKVGLEELVNMLTGFALRADQIINSWRSDYGSRPALSFLSVPLANGTYRQASTVDEALNLLALMEDERVIQRRTRNLKQVQDSANSWEEKATT